MIHKAKSSEYEEQIHQGNNAAIRTGLEIAVIGMAGRFPGAPDIHRFWKNIIDGIESISFFSREELEEAGVDSQLLDNPNYVRAKGILEGSEYFDASFFGYLPVEAVIMDPQVRVLHECAWAALEDAGYVPETFSGLIGLYAGAVDNLYWQVLNLLSGGETGVGSVGEANGMGNAKVDPFSAYLLSSRDHLASRISYKLNLKGPSMFIQTACSTSLTTIDNGCRALLTGICDMVLAGGITITYPRKTGFLHQEGMIYSSDGHCRVFDAKASGTVPAEGAGIVALKRLEEAEADGDHIYAVLKGFAVNNDGMEKVGYTAPSVTGQANVIRDALRVAMVEPESIGYIETHGTGTHLGDPVEIEALKSVFHTDKKHFCAIGSVKANLGHTNNAAGIAGLIKTVLILKHGLIPPSLHFENPNPEIDFENSPFYVNTKLKEWKCEGYPRRAGVSSFGIGGTNVHVVLEEYTTITFDKPGESKYDLILLSTRTANALEKATENLFLDFKRNPKTSLPDAAYTLQVGRKHFNHRRTAVCSTLEEVLDVLAPENRFKTRTYTITTRLEKKRPAVFLFPGQGAQYVAMGLDLYRKEPLFRQEMDRCNKILTPLVGYDIKQILYPSFEDHRSNIINQTEIAQPLIFAFEYALATLLISWGIEPDAMVGHSIGEYTAACLAGVFSLEDALELVALRSRLMQQMPPGAMLSVAMLEEQLKPLLTGDISLAAVNSPCRCVVSGPCETIDTFETEIKAGGIECTRLHTSHAFHSQMMDPILESFRKKVGAVRLNKPGKPYIANVSGQWVTSSEAMDPSYWIRHLRETVRFSDGIKLLLAKDDFVFIEVGPGNSLTTLVKQQEGTQTVLNLVRSSKEEAVDDRYLLDKIGQLWLYGISINWPGFHRGKKRCRVSLPTYPFEGRRFPIADNLLQKAFAAISGRNLEALTGQLNWQEAGADPPAGEIAVEKIGPDTFSPRPGLSVEYVKPRNLLEQVLVDIWQPYFGLEKIGIHDNFFELGGDSLKGMTLVNQYKKLLGEAVLVAIIFNAPTIAELADYFTKNHPQAAARIRQGDSANREQENINTSIQPAEKKEYYILSSPQKRIYILQQMNLVSTTYNITLLLELEGRLQKEKLEGTFKKLIARHEILRTSFFALNEQVFQKVNKEADFKIELQEKVDEGDKIHHSLFFIQHFIRHFDLSCAPLLRVGLINKSEEKHILMMDMHHIASDGTSVGVLAGEFMDLYAGKDMAPLRIQYKDYALWLNSEKEKERIKKQEAWWLKEFPGEIPVLQLPLDYPRPAIQSFEGSQKVFDIELGELEALKQSSQEQGVTLYMLLLSIYSIFLYKLSGQNEAVIGTHIANRRHSDLERVIGMFVNTLALTTYPEGSKTFKEFLKEIKEKTMAAFENQEYPFEDLVEKVAVNRDLSRNPLFDVSFLLQNIEIPAMEIAGLKLKPYPKENNTAKFDLTLQAFEIKGPGNEKKLRFILEYSTRLFKPETIERFIRYYHKILLAFIRDPGQKISGIEIISEAERRQILEDFNVPAAEYQKDKTIHELFAEQVERSPDHIAVVGAAPHGCPALSVLPILPIRPVCLTYCELNKQSNGLTYLLIEKGILAGDIVGIMMERSIDLITGIVGIIKTGAAYLPIDGASPKERVEYMLKDSRVKLLVNEKFFGGSRGAVFQKSPPGNVNLAYIIYTSGTTGIPKGVPITHANLCPLLHWGYDFMQWDSGDRVIQTLACYFDWSAWEIFLTLTSGASLYMISEEILLSAGAQLDFIRGNGITVMETTPTRFQALISSGLKPGALDTLKCLCIGAEKLTISLAKHARELIAKNCRVFNLYGPTEATIISAALEVDMEALGQYEYLSGIPIGRMVGNGPLLVLDKFLNVCPVNVAGELYISGNGVACGYLNNSELTAEKFILPSATRGFFEKPPLDPAKLLFNHHSPFTTHYSLLYKTGDLARWLNDGNIEFLGRIDQQVKIRGFRIELGEIESRLLMHEAVKEVAVVCRESEDGDKYLCAYIVGQQAKFREHLLKTLPDYMTPSYFIIIDKIPVTSSGKVDKKMLPEPMIEKGTTYTPPRDNVEMTLVEVWAEVLKMDKEKIGIDTSFFQLGGHSLNATIMVSRVHKVFGAVISLTQIFKLPTIRLLAESIKSAQKSTFSNIEPIEKKEYYELSYNQKRLWIIQQAEPADTSYNMVGIFLLPHYADVETVKKSLLRITQKHESFRTAFKEKNGEPFQFIEDSVEIPLDVIDISALKQEEKENKRKIIIAREKKTPFDLAWVPLFRVMLVKQNEDQCYFIFNMHHIISDGWSFEILEKDFLRYYEAYKSGQEVHTEVPPLQYKDFAAWQNCRIQDPGLKENAYRFWLNKLEKGFSPFHLPGDFERTKSNSTVAVYRTVVSNDIRKRLHRLAASNTTSVFMVMFSIFNWLLARFSGRTDILCDIISAGREHIGLQDIVGFFVNSLPAKIQVNTEEDFDDFLQRVDREIRELFQYQSYPLELVLDEYKIAYPEVSICFNMLNLQETSSGVESVEFEPTHAEDTGQAKFDLVLYATESKNAITLNWSYRESLFKAQTIGIIAGGYLELLGAVTSAVEEELSDRKE